MKGCSIPAPAPGAIIKQDHARDGRCHRPDTLIALLTSIGTRLACTVLIGCHLQTNSPSVVSQGTISMTVEHRRPTEESPILAPCDLCVRYQLGADSRSRSAQISSTQRFITSASCQRSDNSFCCLSVIAYGRGPNSHRNTHVASGWLRARQLRMPSRQNSLNSSTHG